MLLRQPKLLYFLFLTRLLIIPISRLLLNHSRISLILFDILLEVIMWVFIMTLESFRLFQVLDGLRSG